MALGIAAGEQDVVGHVLQERGVEHRGLLEGQRRDKPRLGAAGRRGFGHEGDAAACRDRCTSGIAGSYRLAVQSVRMIHAMCPQ